jgi:hypothetical protein
VTSSRESPSGSRDSKLPLKWLQCKVHTSFAVPEATAMNSGGAVATGSQPLNTLSPDQRSAAATTTVPPVHNLIAYDNNAKRPLVLNPRLRYDFLGRRFKALSESNPNVKPAEDDHYWNGATALERTLAGCCCCPDNGSSTLPLSRGSYYSDHGNSTGDNDDDSYPGALDRSKVIRFVGLIALHGHDLASKALALAILERTQEADEEDLQEWEEETMRLKRQAARNSTKQPDGPRDTGPPPPKKRKLSFTKDNESADESESSEEWDHEDSSPGSDSCNAVKVEQADVLPPDSMSSAVVLPRRTTPPSRLVLFLKAGGLPILSRWLLECTTATSSISTASSSTTKVPLKGKGDEVSPAGILASPTSALLLPLLLFLQKLPFDLKTIRQSKINKRIMLMIKALEAIPSPHSPPSARKEVLVSPKASVQSPITGASHRGSISTAVGHVQIARILEAVNALKRTWEERAKSSSVEPEMEQLEYPFADLMSTLEDRLNVLNNYEASKDSGDTGPLPQWLVESVSKRQKAVARPTTSKQTSQSLADKARRERENERISNSKADLEKTLKERRELLRKLRAKQQLNDAESMAAARKNDDGPNSQKSVRWKDNLGPMATMRRRDVLEEVHLYDKNEPPCPDSPESLPAEAE